MSSVLAQPKRLCLLAYLAMARGPVSRSTVVALFWPESDEERARNALSQALFHLRRSLSKDVVESVDGNTRLAVDTERLQCDARDFLLGDRTALHSPAGSATETAQAILDGADFFEGWNADDCQALQEWIDGVRRQLREQAAIVLRSVAANDAAAAPPAIAEIAGRSRLEGEAVRAARPDILHRARRHGFAAAVVVIGVTALAAAVVWNVDEGAEVPPGVTPTAGSTAPAVGSPADVRPIVAVLMPSVTAADSSIPRLADAVQGEILAALDGIDGIRAIPFSSADAGGLERFLAEQFQSPAPSVPPGVSPDWVIIVSLRIAGSRIRAITQFRDGSESHRDWYPEGDNYDAPTPGDALIEVPQEIARDVTKRFEGWIARERPTPRQSSR